MSNRDMSQRMLDLATAALSGVGIVGASEVRVLAAAAATGAPYSYWQGWAGPGYFHTDLETAMGLCTGSQNEVVLVTPESHPQGDAVTWSKSITHLVGMYGPAFQNHRSRIGHSVTLSNLLTVSGSGCTFANLYFPYGIAAADTNLLTVSGDRNSFVNCHFLPSLAAALDDAAYSLVTITGSENYFKNCFFGGDTVAWTNGDMMTFGTAGGVPRTVFENCIFLMNADNAQVNFLSTPAGLGRCMIVFKGCQFFNMGTALTLGIDGTGLGNAKMAFDANCYFAGCTDVVGAAAEGSVWFAPANTPINQVTGGASVALFNGLAATPDVS